ncbi:MAG: hypothetical protein KDG49_01195, partial [Geminicoccaceae bacterium]|nr:hypothetical protein [Geminicoccaceae bacterium]
VAAVEPAEIGMAALGGLADRDHALVSMAVCRLSGWSSWPAPRARRNSTVAGEATIETGPEETTSCA